MGDNKKDISKYKSADNEVKRDITQYKPSGDIEAISESDAYWSNNTTKFGESQHDESLTKDYFKPEHGDNVAAFERVRGAKQDNWDKAANGIIRAAAKIVPRTVEGIVNPFYGSVAALTATNKDGKWDPDASKFWDNAITNGVTAASEFLDKELPLYSTKEAEDTHGFSKLLKANTVFGDIMDGMSYSAAAMLSGSAMTKVAGLVGKTAAMGKAKEFLSGLKSIDNATDATKYINQWENTVYNVKDGLKKGAIAFVGASTEASDNALSDSKEWAKKMEHDLTHSMTTGEKIRDLTDKEREWLDINRKDLGNASFAMNIPVIMADNWITFGKSMLSKKSVEKALFTDVADKSVYNAATDTYTKAVKSTVDKVLQKTYGARQVVKPMLAEGAQEWEQLAVSKGTDNYYTKKYYNPESASFLDSFGMGLASAMSTEGLEAFMIGAISSGVFGNAVKLKTEGTAGFVDQTDNVTAKAIKFLNDNKSQPAYKAMVEAFHRHANLTEEQNEALKNGDDFEYMNKASDMMLNHITSKIKTGKLEDFKKQLSAFSNMSPEEFETSYGIKMSTDELTGMKQTMSQFIKPKLEAATKIEKLHQSLENMFPNADQSIKDRLLHTAYSLDDASKRANELSSKVQKTLQSNYLKYGEQILADGALLPTNYFKLKADDRKVFTEAIEKSEDISPLDKTEILNTLKDIDKLDDRRVQFIKDYKSLSDPKNQAKIAKKDAKAEAAVQEAIDEVTTAIQTQQKDDTEIVDYHDLVSKATSDKELDAILDQADRDGVSTPDLAVAINKKRDEFKPKNTVSHTPIVTQQDDEDNEHIPASQKIDADPNLPVVDLDGNPITPPAAPVTNTGTPSSKAPDANQMYPNTKTVVNKDANGNVIPAQVLPNSLRDRMASQGVVMSSADVQQIIEDLKYAGQDINDHITIEAVEYNKTKSVKIMLFGRTLGFFQLPQNHTPEIQAMLEQIKIGDKLSNEEVKKTGFRLTISNGYVKRSNTAVLLDGLDPIAETNGSYIIHDQGTKTAKAKGLEPTMITSAILPGDPGSELPKGNIRKLGRYVLSFFDRSGNLKHIALKPAKLADYNSYINKLKDISKKVKTSKLTNAEVDDLNEKANEGVFIAADKTELAGKSIHLSMDIHPFTGELRVNAYELLDDKYSEKPIAWIVVKSDDVANMSNDELIAHINDMTTAQLGLSITPDSFRNSIIKDAELKKGIGRLFEAYVAPQVLHGQDIIMTVDKATAALNTVQPANKAKPDFSKAMALAQNMAAAMPTENRIEKGGKVTINYVGKPFTGTITKVYGDTSDPTFDVKLDNGTILNGQNSADLVNSNQTQPKAETPAERRAREKAERLAAKKKDDDANNLAYKLSDSQITEVIDEIEKNDLNRILPKGITVETREDLRRLLKGISTSNLPWGFFKDKVIYLATKAGKGTGYHEAFHAIFRYAISNEDVERYLKLAAKEVQAKYSTREKLFEAMNKLRSVDMSYQNLTDEQIYALLLEEHMADRFMEWKNNKEVKTATGLKQLFKRLWNVIKGIFNKTERLDTFFDKIDRGAFSSTKATANKQAFVTNVAYKNLLSGPKSFMSSTKSKQMINTYAARIKSLSRNWDGKTDELPSNEQLLEDLIEQRIHKLETTGFEYVDSLEDREQADRIEAAINEELFTLQNEDGRALFVEQVKKKLKLFDIDKENITEGNDLQDQEDNDDNKGGESFGSKESWTMSLEEGTNKVIREYIAFAMYETLDELTNEMVSVAVDASTIYNGLGHVLANTEESQMLNKMIAYAKDNEQAKAVLDMIMSDTGMSYNDQGLIVSTTDNENDLRKIITAFKNVKIAFYHTEFNPEYEGTVLKKNTVRVYNANMNRAEKISMTNWANNLQEIKRKNEITDKFWTDRINKALVAFTKSKKEVISEEELNNQIKEVQSAFKNLGITLSNGYVRFSILKYKQSFEDMDISDTGKIEITDILTDDQNAFINNFKDVAPLNIDFLDKGEFSFKSILLQNKINPYDTKDNGTLSGHLTDIARGNGEFDESLAASNFKGADDNTRYDIIKSSYVLDETLKLRNKGYRDSLMKKYEILKDNILFKNDTFLNSLTVSLIDGVRDHSKTDNEGKVFGDFSEREYLMQHLGFWFSQSKGKVQTLFRQNEASNTAYIAEMPVQKLTGEEALVSEQAVDMVYSFFEAEYNRISREKAKGLGNIKGYNDTENGRAFRLTEFANLYQHLNPITYNNIIKSARAGEQLDPGVVNEVKKALRKQLETQITEFKTLLQENKLAMFDEKTGKLLGNKAIPTHIGEKHLTNAEMGTQIAELYLNDYINSFSLNQLFDGDYALSRDDKGTKEIEIDGVKLLVPKQDLSIDIVKRHKGAMGSGSDLGSGEHRVAFIKDVNIYLEKETKDGNLVRTDKKDGADKVNSNDAQSYTGIGHLMFMTKRLGRNSKAVQTILRKIRRGTAINVDEQLVLEDSQASLNPWKTVTFGREFYIKTSEAFIDRHEVSYITDKEAFNTLMDELETLEDGGKITKQDELRINNELVKLYKPIRGKEYLHRLLNQMDIHGIDQVVAESASKGMTLSPVDSLDENMDLSQAMIDIPNRYKRLQVETPTGKNIITAGTQLMQLIDSEQDDSVITNMKDSNGKKMTVGQIRKLYREAMANTRNNSFQLAVSYIKEVSNGVSDISLLKAKFTKALEASGADDQLLEIFGLNWNLLPAIDKAEQLFLSHFGSGVMSQKVPGTKVSLMSDAHFDLVIDENGKPVLNKSVKADPSKYEKHATRKLLHNTTDEATGQVYSECVLSERVFSKFKLKIGDEIPTEVATMLGYRIPTQDKHSMISLRVVDILPVHFEGTGIFPAEIVHLSGADFDIDSLFIQQPSFWMKNGKPVKSGTEVTDDDKWESFLNYVNRDKLYKTQKRDLETHNVIFQELKKKKGKSEEEKKDLKKESKKISDQALRDLGLPTSKEELVAMIKDGKNPNNDTLNNQILDSEIELLTNAGMKEIALTPVTSDPLKAEADHIQKLKGGSNVKAYSSSSLLGKAKAFFQNSAGKAGIGPVANGLQAFTFLAKNGIKRIGLIDQVIDGKSLDKFEYKSFGQRIADTLSTVLSVMTDNAKDPIAGKMGLTLELLNTYNYLLSLGVPLRTVSLIINMPSVQAYARVKKEAGYGFKTNEERTGTLNDKITAILEKSGYTAASVKKQAKWYEIDTKIASAKYKDLSFLEEIIKDGTTNDTKYTDAIILAKFLQFEKEAKYFGYLNNLIKLTKGLPTSFTDVDKGMKESLYKLELDEMFREYLPEREKNQEDAEDRIPFNITEAVENDPLLKSNIKNALEIMKKAEGIFITETKPFRAAYTAVLDNVRSTISKDQAKELKRSLLGYITTRAYINHMKTREINPIGNFNPAKHELLFPELGGETLASQLLELKNSPDEKISKNAFIDWLKPEFKTVEEVEGTKSLSFDKVSGKSFIKLSTESINSIVNAFQDLLGNEETKEFALNSFHYLIAKDNMEYKNDSFVKYIAPVMFKNVSLGLEKELEGLANGQLYDDMMKHTDDFLKNLAAHPSTQKSFITKLKATDIGVTSMEGEDTDNNRTQNKAFTFRAGEMIIDSTDYAEQLVTLGFQSKSVEIKAKEEVKPVTKPMQDETPAEYMDKVLDDISVFDNENLNEAKTFIDMVYSTVKTKAEAKKVYYKMANKFHPDKSTNPNAEETFKYLNNTNEDFNKGKTPKSSSFEDAVRDYWNKFDPQEWGVKKVYKFPKFLVININKDKFLFENTSDELVNWGESAVYVERPTFGYNTVSLMSNTYEDNITAYTEIEGLKNKDKKGSETTPDSKALAQAISGSETLEQDKLKAKDMEQSKTNSDNKLDNSDESSILSIEDRKQKSISEIKEQPYGENFENMEYEAPYYFADSSIEPEYEHADTKEELIKLLNDRYNAEDPLTCD